MNKTGHDKAVAWAREELAEIFVQLKRIEASTSQSGIDVFALVEQLNSLAHSDGSWVAEAARMGDLAEEELRRAWRAGIAPDDHASLGRTPYLKYLTYMVKLAVRNVECFDALRRHAAGFVDRGDVMPFELRSFLTKILRDDVLRPVRRGSPKIHEARDILLHALLHDIMERFQVTGMRGRAASETTSACDILAEAMPRRPRLPKSYGAVERILLKGNKALEGHVL